MKAKSGFNLRTVCGENIIVAEGKENIDFSNIISMNESSAYLWQKIQEMESFTVEDLAKLLQDEYDVDEATAHHDSEILAAQWGKAQIIEGDDIPAIEVEVTMPTADSEEEEEEEEENKETATPQPTEQPKKRSFFSRMFARLFGKK